MILLAIVIMVISADCIAYYNNSSRRLPKEYVLNAPVNYCTSLIEEIVSEKRRQFRLTKTAAGYRLDQYLPEGLDIYIFEIYPISETTVVRLISASKQGKVKQDFEDQFMEELIYKVRCWKIY